MKNDDVTLVDEPAWFVLIVKTVGLMGGFNLGQPYDFDDACSLCGSGSRALPPLFVDRNGLGKERAELTAHEGHLVVTSELADHLRSLGRRLQTLRGWSHGKE